MKLTRLALGLPLFGGAAAIALSAPLGGDYPGPTCPTCDFAGPPIEALAHGHIATFFHTQTIMGPVSLVLRAPLAALSYVGHHSLRWEYRLGSLIGLLAVALLAWWVTRMMEADGRSGPSRALAAGLMLAGPVTFRSLFYGHPEELLAGALCVAAVLFAHRRRELAAGLLLGLAIATKPWALLVLPVLWLTGARRVRTSGVSLGLAGVLTLPMLLGDPKRFWTMIHAYGTQATHVVPGDLWWPYGHQSGLMITPHATVAGYSVPQWIAQMAHPLVCAVTLLLVGMVAHVWRQRPEPFRARPLQPARLLEVLALVFLLRCMLDPGTFSYYHAPFFLALVAAEALGRKRLPYLSIISTLAFMVIDRWAATRGPDTIHAVYMAWSVPLAVWLTATVLELRGRAELVPLPAAARA